MTIAEDLMEKGEKLGIQKGKIQEKQQVLIRLMNKKFSLAEDESRLILKIDDADLLDKALDEVIVAVEKEEVLALLR